MIKEPEEEKKKEEEKKEEEKKDGAEDGGVDMREVAESAPAPEDEEEIRIGVFPCHCGNHIAGYVDIKEVAEYANLTPQQMSRKLKALEKQMYDYAQDLEFEKAARVRDQIRELQGRGLAA